MKNSNTQKKHLVVSEVDQSLVRDFFKDEEELLKYKQEVNSSGLLEELKRQAEEFGETVIGKTYRGYDYELADIGIEEGIYLYSIIRKLQPKVAVETGVCNGFSTAFILLALAANDGGHLHSLDFPEVAGVDYEESTFWQGKRGAVIPNDKEPGWAIPDKLRGRWSLTLGKSQEKLPNLLTELGEIDFFIHDSEHSYDCQWFECTEAYKVLRKNGMLMVDDITWNSAFTDFCKVQNRQPIYVGDDLGFFIK